MTTKTILNVSTEGYKSPALNLVQLQSEGVLCGSTVTGNNTIEDAGFDNWGDI